MHISERIRGAETMFLTTLLCRGRKRWRMSRRFLLSPSLFSFPSCLTSHLNFWQLTLLTNSSPRLTTGAWLGACRSSCSHRNRCWHRGGSFQAVGSSWMVVPTKETLHALPLQCVGLCDWFFRFSFKLCLVYPHQCFPWVCQWLFFWFGDSHF